ncbi:MAG: ABC transporter ATP-binding protein [bacterium]
MTPAPQAGAAPPVSANDYSISTRQLTKTYGEVRAVDALNLSVHKGEIFGFLGPNGSGKTTTIKMLCGLLAPTSGDGFVAGKSIVREPEEVKKHIGYMSQFFSFYTDLTVEENLRFYSDIYMLSPEFAKRRMGELMDWLGLEGYRRTLARALSGGWKQRLALACSILHNPETVFLDEPTSGVDPYSRRKIWDLIRNLSSQGFTMFVTTHFIEEAENCDRIGIIADGKLVAVDTPAALKSHAELGNTFHIATPDTRRVREIAAALDGVLDASLAPDGVKVLTVRREFDAASLASRLSSNGAAGLDIKPVPPTLEDVYIMLAAKHASHTIIPRL